MDTATVIVQVAFHQYYLRDQGVVAEIPDEAFTGGNGLISANGAGGTERRPHRGT